MFETSSKDKELVKSIRQRNLDPDVREVIVNRSEFYVNDRN